jgi:hypothetical protein
MHEEMEVIAQHAKRSAMQEVAEAPAPRAYPPNERSWPILFWQRLFLDMEKASLKPAVIFVSQLNSSFVVGESSSSLLLLFCVDLHRLGIQKAVRKISGWALRADQKRMPGARILLRTRPLL